jgi:hypothetical protein
MKTDGDGDGDVQFGRIGDVDRKLKFEGHV